jgi:hypothetical protein
MKFNYYESQQLAEEQVKHVRRQAEQARLSQEAQGLKRLLRLWPAALVKTLLSIWAHRVSEPHSCAKLNAWEACKM